ncbi:MAG: hypothetical protein BRC31_03925 [Actinobacteria bacterium QS_5_72_10]|nr:MAG: hypothetical protein BRC31_03925 [Actinobacteria bacterium QS_5_72_10]
MTDVDFETGPPERGRTGARHSSGNGPRRFAGTVANGPWPAAIPLEEAAATGTEEGGGQPGAPARRIPVAVSSFVGRGCEQAEVAAGLGDARLVTLTGAAGIGKTRLALAVAQSLQADYSEGAWLVRLEAIADPAWLCPTVASAFFLPEQAGRSCVQTLAERLSERHVLLVLDNCEHLIEACAELAAALLESCPHLSIMATSREPLGITGEQRYEVPPLAVPSAEAPAAPEQLGQCAAVQLFVQRAVATQPRFALTADNAPAVSEICRRLDGLPLALELAAARLDLLTPAQIARRLDERFALLAGGSRTAPARHRSLQAAMEWSYDLLSDAERVLLRRLSVFAGGATLDAVEEVCRGEGVEDSEVLDLLGGLVAQSLVVAHTAGPEPRYRLLETTREFARQRLVEAGEAAPIERRHAAWCVGLVEEAEASLAGRSDQVAWLERLDTEHANLLDALAWSVGGGEAELGLRIAAGLVLFWRVRGRFGEGRDWLERLRAAAPDAPAGVRARALWGSGLLTAMLGDHETGKARADESLALASEAGDAVAVARALYLKGFSTTFADGPVAALPVLEDSAARAQQAGDTWCVAVAKGAAGRAHLFQGDPASARPVLEEALEVARAGGDLQGMENALLGLGWAGLATGDPEAGEARFRECLALAHQLGDRFLSAMALSFLGEIARNRGDHATAAACLEESLSLGRKVGSPLAPMKSLSSLGQLAHDEGDAQAASSLFDRAHSVASGAGLKVGVAPHVAGLGEAALAQGDAETAQGCFDEALTLARDSGESLAAARALRGLGELARLRGDVRQAGGGLHEAVTLQHEVGDSEAIAESLEAWARLEATRGAWAGAVRLLAAAEALRSAEGYERPRGRQDRCDADLAAAREALGAEGVEAAWAAGLDLSVDEAVAYVGRGRGPRAGRPATGWASLTPTEAQVADLAAEGLTNPEIGARLFVSRRTVQSHLANAYAKLGISSRRQLRDAAAGR